MSITKATFICLLLAHCLIASVSGLDRSEFRPIYGMDGASCGIDSAYFALVYFDIPTEYAKVKSAMSVSNDGSSSFADIAKVLKSLGLRVQGVECSIDDLKQFDGAYILQVDSIRPGDDTRQKIKHFSFVYYDKAKREFVSADPQLNFHLLRLSDKQIGEAWTKKALLISK